ncbi:MAG: S8 family peptidase [Gammaproteobacteria bacterium]
MNAAIEQARTDIGGFDQRHLFRFQVEKGFDPENLTKISPEIEFVSQESDEVVVAFASDTALATFEARLTTLSHGESVTNKQVLFALKGIDGWSAEDRTGWALRRDGVPQTEPFVLDVELWPIEDHPTERERLWSAFEIWLNNQRIASTDKVLQPGLILYRLICTRDQFERLLRHRDVRIVDLPPRFGLNLELLLTDIQSLPRPDAPAENAPGVVVLDSGIAAAHPLLALAVGDAQSFLPNHDAADGHGHGTHVAGIALYGDVEQALEAARFLPSVRLFSGRILDDQCENNTGFIENHIEAAVRYFNQEYGCRVFNLSYGDRNKPYMGGHVRGLAFTLDRLSRELGVLFLVSAGNVPVDQQDGLSWRDRYPDYLCADDWSTIDPATALNALTIGSLARYDQNFNSQRYFHDPAEVPVALRNQPSPCTRHGPSVGGAIKPELVAYGGNWAVNPRGGTNYITSQGLGELSTNLGFVDGHLFRAECGTSLAAPHVAHWAARILGEHTNSSANLVRALLVGHAALPENSEQVISDQYALRNIYGYGKIDSRALLRSLENEVTLIAEERIQNKRHHFYEVPIPDDFLSSGRRLRQVTVALAHTPMVRSTRIAYKASRTDFKLVAAPDLNHAVRMFNKATERDDYENIPELSGASVGGRMRGKGTVQTATWNFKQFNRKSTLSTEKLFVVVTRNDHTWGETLASADESYAIVVCLRDRANEQARLYTQIRNRLQARVRARAVV